MERAGYAEAELVENRVAVLLSGGTLAERQAWAEETAERLGGAPTVVLTAAALAAALVQKEGVVYVADLHALGDGAQQQLVRCLLTQEERPKLVLSLLQGGELRADLHYRLRFGLVNLDAPGLRERIAQRRARRGARPSTAKSPARAAAARSKAPKARPPRKGGKAHKPRPRSAKSKRSR